jgi:predicted porin
MKQPPPRASLVRIFLATLSLTSAAHVAQAATVYDKDGAQFDIYGILDVGIGYLEHSYAGSDVFASTVNDYNLNGSPHSFTGLYTGGISMSRVGVSGSYEFSSGQKVFFRLETAINVTSGMLSNNGRAIFNNINSLHTANAASAIDGQFDSRAGYLGVSDPLWGSLQAGRTVNLAFDQVVEFDPVQGSLLYSPLGFSGGICGGLGATENTRLDNSLKYENRIGPVNVGLQYKVAGDKNSQSAGRGWVAMLAYSQGPFTLKATYSQEYNSVVYPVQYSNVVAPDPNLQIENTKGTMVSAKYLATDALTLKAGYEYLQILAPSDPNLTSIQDYFGLILPDPAVNASGQQRFSLGWVGGDYRLNERFDVGLGVYDIDTYNEPEVQKNYLALAYSLLLDYNFTKKFDSYIGVMLMHYTGIGLDKHAPIDAVSNNGMYGIGVRYKF